MQRSLLALLLIPIALAHYYSVDYSLFALILALVSVSLLVFSCTQLIALIRKPIPRTTVGLVVVYILTLYFAAQFISYYLQGTYFNRQFFFHLNLTNIMEARAAYYPLIILTIVWTLSVLASYFYFRNKPLKSSFSKASLFGFMLVALALDPGIRSSVSSSISSALSSQQTLALIEWDALHLNPEALEPKQATAVAGKNLVLIFLEGFERIYTDENLFPGLTPAIHELNTQGWQLSNLQQVPGSEWTMGGIVSSLCGTPLLYESSLSGNEVMFSQLLDKATCLPDVLDSAGYEQIFMGGASLAFAGKGDFLRAHGYDLALGRNYLKDEIEDAEYIGGWGLYDDSLFSLALDQYHNLAASGNPFNLTLLTVDTHHPTGEPSSSCSPYENIDNSILHAVHCTDFLLGNFIEQLKQHPTFSETLVVLVSDHLAMRNNAFSLFPRDYQRSLYFNVLNADGQTDSSSKFSTPMDLPPTLLSLLDVEHDVSFLAGVNLLETPAAALQRDIRNTQRLDTIRYLNSHHLSTVKRNTVYSLSSATAEMLEYSPGIENIELSEQGLQFDSTTDDPYFLLPALQGVDYDKASLHITVQNEQYLDTKIYYKQRADEDYSEENTIRREINAGVNQMIFRLNGIADDSRIRIDPGHIPTRYSILEIEIRSE